MQAGNVGPPTEMAGEKLQCLGYYWVQETESNLEWVISLFTQTQKTGGIIIIIIITIVILILAIQKLIGRREKLTTLIKVLDHARLGSFLRSPSL